MGVQDSYFSKDLKDFNTEMGFSVCQEIQIVLTDLKIFHQFRLHVLNLFAIISKLEITGTIFILSDMFTLVTAILAFLARFSVSS